MTSAASKVCHNLSSVGHNMQVTALLLLEDWISFQCEENKGCPIQSVLQEESSIEQSKEE